MPIQLVRNDITKMHVDAIVNAANNRLMGGSGVNGAIHKAAGPELLRECLSLGGCSTGEAKLTGAYALPCRYVIHTVGPVWYGGNHNEEALLSACYRNSLALAQAQHCMTVAFPVISSGIFGYPKALALQTAMDAISNFLLHSEEDMTVYLVIFDNDAFHVGSKLFPDIAQYIDDHYADAHIDPRRARSEGFPPICASAAIDSCTPLREDATPNPPQHISSAFFRKALRSEPAMPSLSDALAQIDESFSQMVLRKIKEKGMKNADCYKRANLDKKLFSKIHNNIHYKPKKFTALSLAIALELSLEETKELLMKAGLALTHSEKFDIIVEYFILHGNYNIFEINEVLFFYDQPLLGSVIS